MRYVRAEMTSRKWLPLLLVALTAALIAAGCGDDDDSDGDTTGGTTTTETESAPTVTDEEGRTAIEACVESGTVPGISSEARSKIQEACETAASGDPLAAQQASAEACRIVAQETLPKGPVREQALAACGTAPGGSP
jgi:hypothetical protein